MEDKNTIIMSEINATIIALKQLEQDYELTELGAVFSEGDGITSESQEEFPIRKLTYEGTVVYEQMMRDPEGDDMLVSHRFEADLAPSSVDWDFEVVSL